MKHTVYICPICYSPSRTMKLVPEAYYEMTEEEKNSDPLLGVIGHEYLLCVNCKLTFTWFDLLKITGDRVHVNALLLLFEKTQDLSETGKRAAEAGKRFQKSLLRLHTE